MLCIVQYVHCASVTLQGAYECFNKSTTAMPEHNSFCRTSAKRRAIVCPFCWIIFNRHLFMAKGYFIVNIFYLLAGFLTNYPLPHLSLRINISTFCYNYVSVNNLTMKWITINACLLIYRRCTCASGLLLPCLVSIVSRAALAATNWNVRNLNNKHKFSSKEITITDSLKL